jgi:hypothetical protein
MAPRHDRLSRPGSLALCLAVMGCAGGPAASSPSSSSALRLSQSGAFSQSVGLAGDDQIVALGRVDSTHVAASTKSGKAFDLDLDAGSVSSVDPWFHFDGSSEAVFTVSKDYTWVLYIDDAMIGRNASPPDANNKFDISKVPVDDLIKNAAKLTPIAATNDQCFFVTKDSLVVFTFNSNSVGRKKIPLMGGSLGQNEHALGAGSIDDPSKGYGEWLVTDKRLMRYLESSRSWSDEPLVLKTGGDDPTLLSLVLSGKTGAKEAGTVGLFDGNTITSLDKPSSLGAKPGSSSSSSHSSSGGGSGSETSGS